MDQETVCCSVKLALFKESRLSANEIPSFKVMVMGTYGGGIWSYFSIENWATWSRLKAYKKPGWKQCHSSISVISQVFAPGQEFCWVGIYPLQDISVCQSASMMAPNPIQFKYIDAPNSHITCCDNEFSIAVTSGRNFRLIWTWLASEENAIMAADCFSTSVCSREHCRSLGASGGHIMSQFSQNFLVFDYWLFAVT